jgi:hypothetical protein
LFSAGSPKNTQLSGVEFQDDFAAPMMGLLAESSRRPIVGGKDPISLMRAVLRPKNGF